MSRTTTLDEAAEMHGRISRDVQRLRAMLHGRGATCAAYDATRPHEGTVSEHAASRIQVRQDDMVVVITGVWDRGVEAPHPSDHDRFELRLDYNTGVLQIADDGLTPSASFISFTRGGSYAAIVADVRPLRSVS